MPSISGHFRATTTPSRIAVVLHEIDQRGVIRRLSCVVRDAVLEHARELPGATVTSLDVGAATHSACRRWRARAPPDR